MKSATMWMLVGWVVAAIAGGCSDDPNLSICEGGACERQEQCAIECEDVCGDPDFGSFECVEERCQCQCFFGCR